MRDATGTPTTSYYDYIIIGGGTAGCPLAATLSQNASVLLLERGGAPYNNANITRLSAFGAALSDLSEASPSQRFISEDGVINARARVLGGGSALNAGFYTRAGTKYVRLVLCKLYSIACMCINFKYDEFSLFMCYFCFDFFYAYYLTLSCTVNTVVEISNTNISISLMDND